MKKNADTALMTTPEYGQFIEELKARITVARLTAARAINRDLILLYWDIGRGIVEKQKTLAWGDSVIDRVSADLQDAFPATTGFSPRNLRSMKQFYLAYSDPAIWLQAVAKLGGRSKDMPIWRQPVAKLPARGEADDAEIWPQPVAKLPEREIVEFLQHLAAEIPWGHNLLILNKLTDLVARLYYLRATAQFGWTRNVLLNQIKAGAYERSLKAGKSHNFALALPEQLAEQTEEMLKSSYNLEFLGIHREVKERELESRLIERLRDFILELGYGFCFVGRQHRLTIGRKEYFIDLLFYHRFLKALVAFDLKVGPFEPEFAGKMDFYLNLLNDKERAPEDNPSIGIILCAEKDDVEVEYALRTKQNPIGVAEYRLQAKLPVELKGKLPTARQLADVVRTGLPAKRGKQS